MELESYVSHYFERDYGPFKSICNLPRQERERIAKKEAQAVTGINRFTWGEDFTDFRKLADDLTLRCYEEKFGFAPKCRPYFCVLGDADVIGGLYRNPRKIHIDVSLFDESELTFMFPDHFHLVSYYGVEVEKYYGAQVNAYQVPERCRFLGQMYTYKEMKEVIDSLYISWHLERARKRDSLGRYLEVQLWTEKVIDMFSEDNWLSVTPESFTSLQGIKCLVDYEQINKLNKTSEVNEQD